MSKEKKDVGYLEDLITALIHEAHTEWHCYKSFFETEDVEWLRIAHESRKDRGELLDLITKEGKGELWCFNKHTLLKIGAYIEMASRDYEQKDMEHCKKNLDKAKKWLGIFLVKNELGG